MDLSRDFKSAWRSLWLAKGLSLTVILTLALGIGANAAIFSLVRGVLLRPLANADAALELGHNFSLVHDDIEDSDAERHHRPTLWAIWGIPLAINAGDALFALSRLAIYPLMEGFERPPRARAHEGLQRDMPGAVRGPVPGHQLRTPRRCDRRRVHGDDRQEDRGPDRRLRSRGSLLATDDDTIAAAYDDFGYALGMAFQMADDVKGTFWSSTESGKTEAGDVRKRKKTLPMVWALENASEPSEAGSPRSTHGGARATDGRGPAQAAMALLSDAEVAEVLEILEDCGAREQALAEARRSRDRALELLETLPCPPDGKRELAMLVRAVIAA